MSDRDDDRRVVNAEDIPAIEYEVEWWTDEKKAWFDEHGTERSQTYLFVHREKFPTERETWEAVHRLEPLAACYNIEPFKLVTAKGKRTRISLTHDDRRTPESDARAKEQLAGLRDLKSLMHSGRELDDDAIAETMPAPLTEPLRPAGEQPSLGDF